MNTKIRTKKMRGFMCQSTAGSVVCMTGDPHHSVIVPRRPDHRVLIDDTSLITNAKYSRLVGSKRLVQPNYKRPVFVPPIKNRTKDQEPEPEPKSLQKLPPPLIDTAGHVFQVVVMRVSLHCQGCAGKVKKHLSKMEGVTSFSIDLETKMVTVMGHVSPAQVLESISKVKKAEFWT